MIKKGELYYPSEEFKEKAFLKDPKIYIEAGENPVKFWEKIAEQLFWFEKWKRTFNHSPPFFDWFFGGKMNITENIFEKNFAGWEKIKKKPAIIWIPEPVGEQKKILTFQELYIQVCKLANALKRLGIKKGDRVCIFLPKIPELVISMLACARIGAVHVVGCCEFSAPLLKHIVQRTKSEIIITVDGYWKKGKLIPLKEKIDKSILGLEIKKIIVVKRAHNEIFWDSERNVWWSDLIEDEKEFVEPEKMESEDIFFMIFTFASQDFLVDFFYPCGGFLVQSFAIGRLMLNLQPSDIFWSTFDPAHIMAHSCGIYAPLLNGATILLYEGIHDFPIPDRWAQILEQEKVTNFFTSTATIKSFKKYGKEILELYSFAPLQMLVLADGSIDEETWFWAFEGITKKRKPLLFAWGQSEVGGVLISSLPGIGPFRPSFAGFPFPGLRVEVLDEMGNICEAGEMGSLVFLPPFSPGFTRGIYGEPETFLKTYWSKYGKKVYFTLDYALRDEEGLIKIIKRGDDLIKTQEWRISLSQLEKTISELPGVLQTAVISSSDEERGEVPIVFLVYEGSRTYERVVQTTGYFIGEKLSPLFYPREIYLVSDLPKTVQGKVAKELLAKVYFQEKVNGKEVVNPESLEELKKVIVKKKVQSQFIPL